MPFSSKVQAMRNSPRPDPVNSEILQKRFVPRFLTAIHTFRSQRKISRHWHPVLARAPAQLLRIRAFCQRLQQVIERPGLEVLQGMLI